MDFKQSSMSQHLQSITPMSPKKPTKQTSISHFDNHLADAAFRQAAEGGFLVSPSRSFLLERWVFPVWSGVRLITGIIIYIFLPNRCWSPDKKRSLKEIHYIHLSFAHIRTLGHIQACKRLKICILHNNYLSRFSALSNCPELIRLDLHSNQVCMDTIYNLTYTY